MRYSSAKNDHKDMAVESFRCPLSGRCFSVIPKGMMPYRSLPSHEAATYADQQSGLAPAEQITLAQSARQRRSRQSFWVAFGIHAIVLAVVLGIDLTITPAVVWRTLRGHQHDSHGADTILIALHGQQRARRRAIISSAS